jgi:Flp pilus assembly protein TadD/cell division protein FtsN
MNSHRNNRKAMLGTACSALVAVLLAGTATSGALATGSPDLTMTAKLDRKAGKSIAAAEKQAAKAPQSAAARISLAQAYMAIGRFESAAASFEDARYLGDSSARTALGLALAQVAGGNGAEAVAVLDGARDQLPASDYGLALALAGETERGVDVLASALRGGENTVKLRQNLAYAYALDGRWSEARLMASQDVPADKLDARITEWAKQGKPEDFRLRVAAMLGAPVRSDMGRPAQLAIARDAATEIAALPVPTLAANSASAAVPAGGSELPPVDNGESFWVAEAARPEPVPAPLAPTQTRQEVAALPPVPGEAVAGAAGPEATSSVFATAFSSPVQPAAPVAQPVARSAAPAIASAPVRKARKVAMAKNIFPGVKAAANGSHLLQLGSFSSRGNAERAWSIFLSRNPELASFDRTVTEAVVGGKRYWRVSAAGFDRGSARQMCSTVKTRGGDCIMWAAGKPLPGAIRKD